MFLVAGSLQVQAQDWSADLKSALRDASSSGREVLLFFTAGERCENCLALEDKVLSSSEFLDFAKNDLLLVKQDFQEKSPEKLEENLLIVEKYNKDGFFPLMVFINKSGKITGQLGTYNNETPAEYIAKLKSVRRS